MPSNSSRTLALLPGSPRFQSRRGSPFRSQRPSANAQRRSALLIADFGSNPTETPTGRRRQGGLGDCVKTSTILHRRCHNARFCGTPDRRRAAHGLRYRTADMLTAGPVELPQRRAHGAQGPDLRRERHARSGSCRSTQSLTETDTSGPAHRYHLPASGMVPMLPRCAPCTVAGDHMGDEAKRSGNMVCCEACGTTVPGCWWRRESAHKWRCPWRAPTPLGGLVGQSEGWHGC